MQRLLAIAAALGAAAIAFALALARAAPETRFYTLISAQLVLVIVAVVVVSSLFTVLYLVAFGAAGRRAIADRFPLFVGWKLLRSQRQVETWGSRLARAWRRGRARSAREVARWLAFAAALVAAAWALDRPAAFDALADASSAGLARALQVTLLLLAAIALAGTVPAALARAARALRGAHPPGPPATRLRDRTAVTLPTFISIVGVSIGVWALVVVLSVMHGFEEDLREKILRTDAHLVVEPEDAAGVLGDAFGLVDAVRAVPGVVEAIAFAHGEVMMASQTNIAVNVVLKGLDPADLERSEQVAGRVAPGAIRFLDRPELLLSDRARYPLASRGGAFDDLPGAGSFGLSEGQDVLPGVLLGVELAASLHVDVGSEIQVISPDGDVGPTGLRPRLRAVRVAGLVTTGMYEYDQKLAYMAVSEVQRFFNLGADLNKLEVRLASAEDTGPALAAVRGILAGRAPQLAASDWQARNKSLFSALQLERLVMFLVLGFIILVSSLLIVSSLAMLIVEKARDIAVLKALGASNRGIRRTFLVIGGVIGVIGSASGLTLGVGTCLLIQWFGVPLPKEYYITSLPVVLDPLEVAVVGVSAFLICLGATLWPARDAAGLRPVEGLRHG